MTTEIKKFVNERKIKTADYDNMSNWSGYIIVPKELTPKQFNMLTAYFKRKENEEENEDDNAPHFFMSTFEFYSNYVMEWHIDGMKEFRGDAPVPAGEVPSIEIIKFVLAAVDSVLRGIHDLPKLRGVSKNGTPEEPTM